MVRVPLRGLWLGMLLCGLLGLTGTARAATLVHPGQTAKVTPVEALQEVASSDDTGDENPWTAVLWAPMYLPFPWSALLDGYVPWGRYAWVKNLTAGCLMGCGSCMIGIFPFTLVFAVLSLVLAVVALAFAVYAFIMGGFKGGCCGVAGRGANVTNDCFSVYNGIMCLSFVMCTPWLGFKLIQRGWYGFRTPIDPVVEQAPERPADKAEDQGLGRDDPSPPPTESMRSRPNPHHALAY